MDLIITDLVMPEQEGVETIRLLRQSHPQIKLVAMCGAFGGRLLETATRLGAQMTLSKPVSPATILKATQDLLRGRQAAFPSPPAKRGIARRQNVLKPVEPRDDMREIEAYDAQRVFVVYRRNSQR